MAPFSGTDRRIESEVEFDGEEYAELDGNLCPSPAVIAIMSAEIQDEWSPDSCRDVHRVESLAQGVVARAVNDIRDLNTSVTAHGEFGKWHGRKTQIDNARRSFSWLCDCDGLESSPDAFTFAEICTLLGADPELVRDRTLKLLNLQSETLRLLLR